MKNQTELLKEHSEFLKEIFTAKASIDCCSERSIYINTGIIRPWQMRALISRCDEYNLIYYITSALGAITITLFDKDIEINKHSPLVFIKH